MKYLLRKAVLGKLPEIEITAEAYAEFEKARNILSNALAIEEKYEIVITNYLDFEKQILDTTTGYMVREHLDYSDFFEIRLGLNIRLVNLLTAARLYVDQLNQNVRECVPNVADAKEIVKKFFSKEGRGSGLPFCYFATTSDKGSSLLLTHKASLLSNLPWHDVYVLNILGHVTT